MVKIEFISDAGVSVTLCDSTRSLAEQNIKLNHKRVLQMEDLAEADYAFGAFRGNRRNTVSFDAHRSQNEQGVEHPDPEGAFVSTIDHTNKLAGSGKLKMTFAGASTSAVRYLHGALLEASDIVDFTLGICVGVHYSFNGGRLDDSPT